jgi:hypothetical protein
MHGMSTSPSRRPKRTRKPAPSPVALTAGTLSLTLGLLALLFAGGGGYATARVAAWCAAQKPTGHGGPQGVHWLLVPVLFLAVVAVVVVVAGIGLALGITALRASRRDRRRLEVAGLVGLLLNLLVIASALLCCAIGAVVVGAARR